MPFPSLLRLCCLAALWGSSFVFLRVVSPVLGAVPTAFWRALLGVLGTLLMLLALRLRPRFGGKLRAALVLGIFNMGLPFLMFALAAHVLPAGYSAILNATAPLMGAILGTLVFGERLGAARAGGIAIGLIGVGVLAQIGPAAVTPMMLLGMGACLLASLCYGLAAFLARRWITSGSGLDGRFAVLGGQCGAVLTLLPGMAWHIGHDPAATERWAAAPPVVWAALLALGLLCTAFAYLLYFRLIADVGPIKTLSVTFLIPLFGVFWARLLLGEPVTLAHALGGGLIALALWLVVVRG